MFKSCEILTFSVPTFMVNFLEYQEDDTLNEEEKEIASNFLNKFKGKNYTFSWGQDEYFSWENDTNYDKGCMVIDCKVVIFN